MSETNTVDYKATLNLPQTDFPMKAGLAQKEPGILEKWEQQKIYEKVIQKNQGRPPFVLHDGPPYANGPIHFGHILNKILKDIIVKTKNMEGFLSEYVPGWDCHGLPIEHQVDKEFKAKKKQASVLEMRRACREYAMGFVNSQRTEFKRLGILGEWDNPYVTMDRSYEATIARLLATVVEKGYVYKGAKPIHWCTHCHTALAEAEVEYDQHESPSIFVKFKVVDDLSSINPRLQDANVSVVIWTTTPWTLPANQAVAVHRGYTYVAVKFQEEVYIIAEGLLDNFRKSVGQKEDKLIERIPGTKLHGINLAHPFLPRQVKVVFSNHVTLETGTGCVHIAPGHGQEDYEVGVQNKLAVLNPVDDYGIFTDEAQLPTVIGKSVFAANAIIIEELKKQGSLLQHEPITHSYPHCWRCKNPVIFRSTPQYFISMATNELREKTLDAIRHVKWIPHWGRERIYGMIETRSDWCISRQRSWGNPLMTFKCVDCGQSLIDAKVMYHIADLFEQHGADCWFEKPSGELLPPKTQCPHCKGTKFEKEGDILDVWFDSGVSFAAVLERRKNLKFPAEMYLEGSDQHRGWFHSSLLMAMASRGTPPYLSVLTHGFVVDGVGKKYSKSAQNYTVPDKILNKVGADVLRLWAASEDYRNDIRFSPEIIDRTVESYRKFRNTLRYLLGNLFDFDANQHYVKVPERSELDRYAVHKLQDFISHCRNAYTNFEFHSVYHAINNFCTNTLSSFYLDILKDRLYISPKNSAARRSAQSTLYDLTHAISRLVAPILSFTAEEIYTHFNKANKLDSIFLENLPSADDSLKDLALEEVFAKLINIRAEVMKALEIARQEKTIGHSLEAQVRLTADDERLKFLRKYESILGQIFIVSQVILVYELPDPSYTSTEIAELKIKVTIAEGEKCLRCWVRSTTLGKSTQHPQLCSRCVKAIEI
ncbi:MAG: isoleucine--tRNA ligase [Deltaproteobacteria bacterium]|nr:isoleucine--tRNA ligase [Deltaproteobacteria bacterium]